MSGVHQLLVSATDGDAVSSATFEAQRVLAQVGPSKIVSRYMAPSVTSRVVGLRNAYVETDPMDPFIFHGSIGQAEVHRFVESHPGPTILQYHNITPSSFFVEHDPVFAQILDQGRSEIARMRHRFDAAWADSSFSADELTHMGFQNVAVCPLIIDTATLTAAPDHVPLVNHLATEDGPVLLFVGQLLPHKRPDLLIQAFHLLVSHHLPHARLILVGPHRNPTYQRAIVDLVRELGLSRCWVAGELSTSELATMYRHATAFVTASEHEGFCVPLVEAMAFGVPIVASARAAIPETLGAGGLLLPADAGPQLWCEAMLAVCTDARVRADLQRASTARGAAFAPDHARRTLVERLSEAL